jgi:hypothetical protein
VSNRTHVSVIADSPGRRSLSRAVSTGSSIKGNFNPEKCFCLEKSGLNIPMPGVAVMKRQAGTVAQNGLPVILSSGAAHADMAARECNRKVDANHFDLSRNTFI